MDKHLHVLVAAQVEVGVFIDRLRLVLAQVLDHQAESLLIVLGQLGLRGVGGSGDAWRQYVGHGLAVGVLLDVDGTHLQHASLGSGRRHEVLLVLPPLAAHQVERSESQHDRLLESCEEHAHEAYAGEVVDAAYLLLVLSQRHTILIPAHGDRVAVAQLGVVVAMVYDVAVVRLLSAVVSLQLVVADGYAVLVVALVLIEGIVLVDVLHVGSRLVRSVVRFRLLVAGRRVTLWVVDALVAVHDALLLGIIVRTTEVVVVIASRVLSP